MYSDYGGATFADHHPGAQPDVHTLAWHPAIADPAYEAGGGGAAWSHDGGVSWQPADAGRERHYVWALAVDPCDPDRWFISAPPNARRAHGGEHAEAALYRWEGQDHAQSEGPCNNGIVARAFRRRRRCGPPPSCRTDR